MVKTSKHRRTIVFVFAIALMLTVCLVAWIRQSHRAALADFRMSQRQYVADWLSEQKDALRTGNQSYVYFYDTTNTGTLLREFSGMSEIKSLMFELTDLTDDGVQTIAELRSIEELTFYGGNPRVGDQGLAILRGNRTLETLRLVNIDVTDDGLGVLTTLPGLKSLTLYRDHFRPILLTDDAVSELQNLNQLDNLNISGGWMSGSAIAELRRRLPDCDVVVNAEWRRSDEQTDATAP